MTAHLSVAFVTLLALILYFVMGLNVGAARRKFGIDVPAVSGHPDFERVFRVQANTLEWLPIFLPSLWIMALYWSDWAAAILGMVWIVGRFLYMTGYARAASARSTGFLVQFLATALLVVGDLIRLGMIALHL